MGPVAVQNLINAYTHHEGLHYCSGNDGQLQLCRTDPSRPGPGKLVLLPGVRNYQTQTPARSVQPPTTGSVQPSTRVSTTHSVSTTLNSRVSTTLNSRVSTT